MQQAELAASIKSCMHKNKNVKNSLTIRLCANVKLNRTSIILSSLLNGNKDVISKKNHAYKDANKDADNYIFINSNIAKEIRNQRHKYDTVSTITLTPIKCQRLKHQEIKSKKTSILSSLTSLIAPSTSLTTSLSSPFMVIKKNCGIYQWSTMLHNYVFERLSIDHKHKHNQHLYFLQQQHALPIKSFTPGNLLSERNKNNSNKHNNISINRNKRSSSNSSTTTDNPTYSRVAIHQSVEQYFNTTFNRSCTLPCLLLTLFIVFTIGVRSTTAGACWQTVLDNGKCNEIFSLNISKSECCGANQEFAYTEKEPTNVEYFFATAIGGGMECAPCLENCKNVKCGPNKKCVKRKGRPKCICAPECGATRRRRKQQEQHKQHHTFNLISSIAKDASDRNNDNVSTATIPSSKLFKIKIDKSQQSRDTRSLSSEITNVNLGVMMINSGGVTSQIARHHITNKEHNENQRKFIQMQRNSYPYNTKEPNDFQQHTDQIKQQHQHQLQIKQHQPKHKHQEPKGSRRVLITANVERTEKPTTIRLQIFSNIKTTNARRHTSNKNNKKSKKNSNRNKHDRKEDTDPKNANDDQQYEDFGYNDAEENSDCDEAKRKYSNSDNSNGNTNKNNNNRNDDVTRFLNQSISRHKFKNIITPSKYNGNNSSSSNNNKSKKQKINFKLKKIQDFTNNTTRVIHPQANIHNALDTSHRSHNRQQEHQHEQHQQQNHHKHHQHRQNHHRHQDRQSNRKQQQQTVIIKRPKNNRDYKASIAAFTSTSFNVSDNKKLEPHTILPQANIVRISSAIITITPQPNVTSLSSSLLSSEKVVTDTTIIPTPSRQSQSLSQLCSSSTMFSLSSATPVNFTMSAINSTTAVSDAANDHSHSHLQYHGSKITTSSSMFSFDSKLSASAPIRSSIEGEGVSQHRRIKIPASKNNNSNKNADHLISTLNSNLHKNRQQTQSRKERLNQQKQQNQKIQSHQQYFHSSLFDENFDQIGLMNIPNKQQHTTTNTDIIRPFNPICGTDGRTYNTECQLRKRACRTDNSNLQIAYRGHCKTTCNGVKCLNGLTCVEDQYSLPHCISCKIECLQDDNDVDATNAVCGADGKTYKSICDINRMICKIGRSIGVAYLGPCREEPITCDDINCGRKQVCLIDLLTHKPRCTSCRYKCSRKRSPLFPHLEENKICGTNNRTYNSWCEMRKDSCSTGFYIDLKYSGNCH